MKSALLAQNDDLAIENLKQSVGRSVFDLSHSTTFPIDVDGAILPICCIETVPSDSFEISCECLLRQLTPLQVPIMANFRLNTAWFWCDNRLGWKKWDRFMTGGRSGNEVYELPRCYNLDAYPEDSNESTDSIKVMVDSAVRDGSEVISVSKCLHTYFGYSQNVHTEKKIYSGTFRDRYDNLSSEDDLPLAFPFFDYQIICRDFYTNVDRLAQDATQSGAWQTANPFNDWAYKNLFPIDDDEFKLVDGLQAKSGFHSGDDPESSEVFYGCYLDKVRYHNVREDYFTSSKKAPLRGSEPTINAVGTTLTLPSGTSITLNNNNGIIYEKDGANISRNSPVKQPEALSDLTPAEAYLRADSTSPYAIKANITAGASISGNVYTKLDNMNTVSGVTASDITVNGDFTVDVTAAELRLLSQLTVWKELNGLHEPYYNDFLNAHFEGVSVGESAVEKPQYIGGTSQHISINEIMQTSQSTSGEGGSPLGNQGAVAMSLANNYVGKFYCNNYGYLIGVAYIITDMYYNPAIPRWSSRRTKEDYYSPEFANLSMQAILNKEIFASNSEEWNNTPFGYTGAFDELRSIPNKVAGDLLNDDYSDLKAWVIRREFKNDNKPSMSTEFLSLKGNVDKTAFSVQSMPAFMLQCANYIKAVRPMPKVAIPKAL